MAVPYTFGSATTSIPLSQLDSNFATTITLGNTAIQLGNTVTTLNNMTLANVTISSGTSNLASTSISNGTSNVTVNSSGGNITLGTAGTTAITVDTSQNVGIGVTPNAWASGDTALQVKAGSSSGGLWGRSNSIRTVANTYYDGTNFKYIASDFAGFMQVSQSGVGGWYISMAPSGTAGTNATFTQVLGGNKGTTLTLEGGTSSSGTGIAFPATQSASSDANTLDDYEEGSFTGTLTGGTTAPSTPITATGYYTKVGKIVEISISFANVNNTGASGTVTVTGLPFTSASNVLHLGQVVNTRGPNEQSCSYISTGVTSLIQVNYAGSQTAWSSTGAGVFAYFSLVYQSAN
jgi:hypothetical protein